MDLLLRRRMMVSVNDLPNGYKKLEYLSNHNTGGLVSMAYINPLVNCDEIGYMETELCYTGMPNLTFGDGAVYNQDSPTFYCLMGILPKNGAPAYGVQFGSSGGEKNFSKPFVSGEYQRIGIDVLNGIAYCNAESINITISNVRAIPLFIFSRSRNFGTYQDTQYLYGSKRKNIKIYDRNMVLIRDLVPALNSNGVAGMFDKVNEVFYVSPNGSAFDQTI